MARIGSPVQYKAWLEDRPREVAMTLTARTALRLVPRGARAGLEIDAQVRAGFLLPVFRAVAAATVAAVGATEARAVARAAAGAFRVHDAAGTLGVGKRRNIAFSIGRAASTAAGVAAFTSRARGAAIVAERACNCSPDSYADGLYRLDAAWRDISADCTWLEAGETGEAGSFAAEARALARLPLWPRATWDAAGPRDRLFDRITAGEAGPEWAREGWAALKAALLAVDGEHWQVWTDWYEARLTGAPLDLALEEARVLLDADNDFALWNRGPSEVNAALARVIEAHRNREGALTPEAVAVATPLGKRIEIDPATGQITSRPPLARQEAPGEITNIAVIDNLRRKLERQIGWFNDRRPQYDVSPVLELVRAALGHGNGEPLATHDDLETARERLDALVTAGNLPELDKAPELAELLRDLQHGISDLRSVYPGLNQMAEKRASMPMRLPTEAEQRALEKAVQAVEPICDERLRGELAVDLPAPVGADAVVGPKPEDRLPDGAEKRKLYRLLGTLSRIAAIARLPGDKLAALVASGVDVAKKLQEFHAAWERLEPYFAVLRDILSLIGAG